MKDRKKLIPIAAIVVMGIIFTVTVKKSGQPLSVNTILRYTPENTILAAVILLAFFALKSLTVVFPLSILYFASGILFHSVAAALISTAGLAITITIPYWIGNIRENRLYRKYVRNIRKQRWLPGIRKRILFLPVLLQGLWDFFPVIL